MVNHRQNMTELYNFSQSLKDDGRNLSLRLENPFGAKPISFISDFTCQNGLKEKKGDISLTLKHFWIGIRENVADARRFRKSEVCEPDQYDQGQNYTA